MSYKINKNCLCFSFLLAALLLFQPLHAQYYFATVEDWVHNNLKDLGGRAVLLIYKDGKLVYNESFNELTRRQKMGAKLIARRAGKDANSITSDYNENTKIGLASCSKWLSAALVMTFVDEGKLQLNDTIG